MLLRWAVNHPSVAGAGLRIETSLLERNTPTRRTGPTPLIPPPARQSSAEPRNIPLGDTDPELASEIARRVGRLVLHRENSNGSFNRSVREKTGIPELSHHRLRHTFATRWLERGGSIVSPPAPGSAQAARRSEADESDISTSRWLWRSRKPIKVNRSPAMPPMQRSNLAALTNPFAVECAVARNCSARSG